MIRKFQIESSSTKVRGFSNFRLPFEPKGCALTYRNQLRKYISELQLGDNQILRAKYLTNTAGFFDVENILFYNVGALPFKNICRNGLIMKSEPNNNLTNKDLDHVVEYQIINKNHELILEETKQVSDFYFKIPALKTTNRVGDYWFLMHSGTISIKQDNYNPINDFGLYIELETNNANFNTVSIMKSLVDGIISGFHIEKDIDIVAEERIAKMLDIEKKTIKKYLLNDSYGVLGRRNLVSSYRNSVKWNPADDRCKELIIIPKISKSVDDVSIEGFLYKL